VIPALLANIEPLNREVAEQRSEGVEIDNVEKKIIAGLPDFKPGIYLGFIIGESGKDYYPYFILNHWMDQALYSFELQSKFEASRKLNGKLEGFQVKPLGEMKFSWLGNNTKANLSFWPVLTLGTGKKKDVSVKIKLPQFFEQTTPVSVLSPYPIKWYPLVQNWKSKSEEQGEDLKSYTKRNAQWDRIDKAMEKHEVIEKAAFNHELDLHAENLTSHYSKMNNLEILKLQIRHFEQYMSKAIQVGAERIFIIHGLGKGKLRDEIMVRLKRYPQVKKYHNEYHPNYGWGATEVIF